MKIDDGYLIFKTDFKHRHWIDWIKSHISLAPPPYRFKGSIVFDSHEISFNGFDIYLKENVAFNINKDDIHQLYYGYDDTFSLYQTRGLGVTWAPIRIRFDPKNFDTEDDESDLYLVSKFNGVYSENQVLFEELKIWLS